MKIIGIIAEYNPFHNGHAYQIQKIRQQTAADYIVVAMSGDFVQRGTPAIIDKYARTKMALTCGADLVIELPTIWSTASAESFAMAGVTLFDKMGCVDGICFGAETDNLSLLDAIAELLVEEPAAYRDALSTHLKEGLSFPAARANALCNYLATEYDIETLHKILDSPNNILAIEYLKAIKKRHCALTPYLIKREGSGYHEENIRDLNVCNSDIAMCNNIRTSSVAPTASATAIRNLLSTQTNNCMQTQLISAMPQPALDILTDYLIHTPAMHENDFSSLLGYSLLTTSSQRLTSIADSNVEIANRLLKNKYTFTTYSNFCSNNKSRDITYTRMSRILLHLILNITDKDYETGKSIDYIPYLRMLGFRRSAAPLLGKIKQSSTVPLISKLANAKDILLSSVQDSIFSSGYFQHACDMLDKDILAADLYEQVATHKTLQTTSQEAIENAKEKTPRSEFTREIVII